jgi:hypothetical protein
MCVCYCRLNFSLFVVDCLGTLCYNPSLGFVTKAKACKVAGQKGSSKITFRAPTSAKECKGMNLHIPK